MNREENTAAEEIGWHVIARGGDMTARVHGGMYLGQGPSGEISFEPVDGIVGLTLEGSQLKLTAVRLDEEFLVPGEQPARAVLVSPQTHVSLCFRNHVLDIDNDFALAHPAGSSLSIEVIDAEAAAARRARGPVSAGRRLRSVGGDVNRTIVVSEVGPSLWTTPSDHLPRSEPRHLSPDVKRPLVIGAALFGIVAGLLALAVYLPARLAGDGPSLPRESAVADQAVPDPLEEPAAAPAGTGTAAATEIVTRAVSPPATDTPVTPPVITAAPERAAGAEDRVSDALLDRFTVLISAERLPDRGAVDFMAETLRSLQGVYPNDARVPEALNLLALRLLDEARTAYESGNAFQAGRLIELAVTTGAAPSAVEETLAGMTRRPAAASDLAAAEDVASAADAGEPSGTEAAGDASASAEATGLDSLVHQATGVPLGALVVDPGPEADTDDVLTLMLDDPAIDPVGSAATGDPAADPSPTADPAATADQLPTGFVLEDTSATAQPRGPVYRPFDELTVSHRAVLTYPAAAPRRRRGSVDVSFTVSESGDVIDVTAESDLGTVFVEAARETIARWRFEPVLVNGQPTAVKSAIRVTFRD